MTEPTTQPTDTEQATEPVRSPVILGRALLDRRRDLWLSSGDDWWLEPGRSTGDRRGGRVWTMEQVQLDRGPAREVLLVDPAAWVRWRRVVEEAETLVAAWREEEWTPRPLALVAAVDAMVGDRPPGQRTAATPEQWRAAYDAKVQDFARETERSAALARHLRAVADAVDDLDVLAVWSPSAVSVTKPGWEMLLMTARQARGALADPAPASVAADLTEPGRCRAEYARTGGRQPGDRIVECGQPAGHGGEWHEEDGTGFTWPTARAEPVPVPDSGPGWEREAVEELIEQLVNRDDPALTHVTALLADRDALACAVGEIRDDLGEGSEGELATLAADVRADRDQWRQAALVSGGQRIRQEALDSALAEVGRLVQERDAARAERDRLRHEAAAFEAMLATSRAELEQARKANVLELAAHAESRTEVEKLRYALEEKEAARANLQHNAEVLAEEVVHANGLLATARRDAAADALELFAATARAERWSGSADAAVVADRWGAEIRGGTRPVPGQPEPATSESEVGR